MVVGYSGGGGTHSKRGEEWVSRPGGGEPFFLSLLEIPPLLWCAYQRREGEREEGGIGGDTHSDICIGRERDIRSLTGMAMFDALFLAKWLDAANFVFVYFLFFLCFKKR